MKTFSAILLAALLIPATAQSETARGSETEWMGDARQWSVGFVAEKPSYCRLVWNNELGKTLEFRQNLDTVMWLVSKDGWDIPEGTTTKVTLVGYSGTKAVPAEAFDSKTLRILPASEKTGVAQIKKMLKNSFIGTPDMELDFAGNEEPWIVPLSRLQQMYTTYVNCLNRLVPANQASQVSDKTQPF
ncbi:hypothetical protein [Rhizobium sp. 1399]|jgi:hypothetical protein|uniref:hypothetical protein n=1 Tax=Rhizobium sp. 1399 TaxID=2817758 RepID=UPI00285EF950|nr:hypothetical protein [Rhizobium sp. 1399]MDR6664290.1 hypothetical protein [Rhizobium sp. 1399]